MKISKELEDRLLAMPGVVVRQGKGIPPAMPLPFDVEKVAEKEFQQAVIDVLVKNLWVYYHTRYSYSSKEGFFDLWAAKHRVLHIELKTETGKLTASQERFRDACIAAGGEYHLWRPSMWNEIVAILEGKP